MNFFTYLCTGELFPSRDLLVSQCFVAIHVIAFVTSQKGTGPMNGIDEPRLVISFCILFVASQYIRNICIHGMSWIKKNKEYIKPNQKITNILLYKKHFKRYFMIHSKAGTPVQAIAEKIYAVLFQVNK